MEARRIKYINKLCRSEWERSFHTADTAVVESLCAGNDVRVSFDATTHDLVMEYACPARRWPRGREGVHQQSDHPLAWREVVPEGAVNAGAGPKDAEPATIVRWEDGSEVSHELMREIGAVAKQLTVEVQWERGDVLMVDNTRVMHGRRDWPDSGRVILVRMSGPA